MVHDTRGLNTSYEMVITIVPPQVPVFTEEEPKVINKSTNETALEPTEENQTTLNNETED
jgi:hypothetical protein